MPWFVSTISIRAFKSFGAETVALNVRTSGLLGIVGPNGAGKSNVLDALCFASGCPPSVLRVKTLRELVAQNHAPELCFVEFGIAQALGNLQLPAAMHTVKVALTQDGCLREYKIDGKAKTALQVVAFLHAHGLYLDSPASVIRQAQVTKLADNSSPDGIAEFVATCSGLSRWMLEAARATEELGTTRRALVDIRASISTLQSAMQKDEANQQQTSRAQDLERQMDAAAMQLARKLHSFIRALEVATHERYLRKLELEAEVQKMVAQEEQAGSALKEASGQRDQQQARTRAVKARRGTMLSRQVASQEEQVRVLEQQLGSIKSREAQAMQLSESWEQLQQTIQQLSSRIERLQDLQEVLEEVQEGSSAGGVRQLSSHAEAARCHALELQELLLAEEQAVARAEAEHSIAAASLQACQDSQARLSEAGAQLSAAARLHQGRGPDAAQPSCGPPSSSGTTALELHQCFAFKQPLQGVCSGAGAGAVQGASTPTHSFIRALATIAGPHLRVVVCGNKAEAARILEQAQAMQGRSSDRRAATKLRIWPLDSISAPDISARQRKAVQSLGPGRAWLPQDLVEATQPAYNACLQRAFGHMIIVRDEECASQASVRYGLACVTLDGLMSRPGSISGGGQGRGPNEALLLDKLASETAVAEERQRAAEQSRLQELLASALEAEEGQARLAEIRSEEHVLAARVLELGTLAQSLAKSVLQLRAECEVADQEASRCQQLLDAAQDAELLNAGQGHKGELSSAAASGGDNLLRQGMGRSKAELEEARTSHMEAVMQLEEVESKLEEELLLLGHDPDISSADFSSAWTTAVLQQPGSASISKAAELQAAVAQLQALHEQVDREQATEHEQQRAAEELEQQIKEMTKLVEQARVKHRTARAEADTLGAKLLVDKTAQKNAGAAQQDLVRCFPHLQLGVRAGPQEGVGAGGDAGDEAAAGACGTDAIAEEVSLASAQLDKLKAARSKIQITPVALAEELLRQERALTLQQLSDHYSSLEAAVQSLDTGLQEARKQVLHANEVVFADVNTAFQSLCSMLLPSMLIRLAKTEECASKGLVVQVSRQAACDLGAPSAEPGSGSGSLEQLSGGQRTLVSLALVLAAAKSGGHSSTLLLDEVDAALDEHNQQTVVRLLRDLSQHGIQLLCVSHHKTFHQACDALLHLSRDATGSTACALDQAGAGQQAEPSRLTAAQPKAKTSRPKQRQRR